MFTKEIFAEKAEFKKLGRELAQTGAPKTVASDSDKNEDARNTTGTGPAPEKDISKITDIEGDLPEIEKGGERGARGEILRPSERESPPDSTLQSTCN